jgi:hypothetical protein
MKKYFSKENVSLALLYIGMLCVFLSMFGGVILFHLNPELMRELKDYFVGLLGFGFVLFPISMYVLSR